MKEEWREIAEFPDYAISSEGNVKRVTLRGGYHPGRPRRTTINRYGYVQVCLSKDGKQYWRTIHDLVLTTFVSPRPEGTEGNHKDGIKLHNSIINLEWLTRPENIKHSFLIGLRNHQGENHPQARLTERDVIEIRQAMATGAVSQQYLADKYGVTQTHISDIAAKKVWRNV